MTSTSDDIPLPNLQATGGNREESEGNQEESEGNQEDSEGNREESEGSREGNGSTGSKGSAEDVANYGPATPTPTPTPPTSSASLPSPSPNDNLENAIHTQPPPYPTLTAMSSVHFTNCQALRENEPEERTPSRRSSNATFTSSSTIPDGTQTPPSYSRTTEPNAKTIAGGRPLGRAEKGKGNSKK